MSNILDLCRINLKQTLDFRQLKKNKARSGTLIGFLALMGILFLAMSTFYSIAFAMILKESNQSMLLSAFLMSVIATMLVLTTSIMVCKEIFVARDFDMLSSMPIRKGEIITSKIINLYIIEAIYASIIMIPNMIVNTVISGDLSFILIGILLLIGVEAFPIFIATILGSAMAIISARFKHSNIIVIVVTLLFFIGVFAFSFVFSSGNEEELTNMFEAIANSVIFINPTTGLIKLGANRPIYYLLYILVNTCIIGLTIGYIASLFNTIHNLSTVYIKGEKYNSNDLKQDGELKSLFNIEVKRMLGSKMYFINSAMGAIIGIAMSIVLCISFKKGLGEPDTPEFLPELMGYMLPIVVMLFATFGTTTVHSISMEGKTFWITKSLPISYKSLINAKLLVGLMILMPAQAISSLILIFFFKASVFQSAMMLVLPLSYILFMNVLGLRLNLWLPKLSWTDEKQVIKQGGAPGILTLFDFLATILVGGMVLLLLGVNEYLALLLPVALLLLLSLLIYVLMLKNSDRLIGKIE